MRKVFFILFTSIVAISGVLYVSKNKTQNLLSATSQPSSDMETELTNSENSMYGEVHALFKVPAITTFLMGTHKGLFQSTDNGKSFSQLEPTGVMTSMEFMNFAYDANTKTLFAGGHGVGVVKSVDNGVTWTKTDNGIKGSDIHALAINPLDNNRLYAFSVDNGVFGTKDGAKNWYRIDDGPTNPSVRAFGYMGTASDMDRSMKTDMTTNIGYLWAGTGGGLYSSFACFCGWTNATGISDNTTVYALAPDPVIRSNMFVGTKKGIYKTNDEGRSFTLINSDIQNVTSIVFDAPDSKIVFAVTAEGLLYKSMDNGAVWNQLN